MSDSLKKILFFLCFLHLFLQKCDLLKKRANHTSALSLTKNDERIPNPAWQTGKVFYIGQKQEKELI